MWNDYEGYEDILRRIYSEEFEYFYRNYIYNSAHRLEKIRNFHKYAIYFFIILFILLSIIMLLYVFVCDVFADKYENSIISQYLSYFGWYFDIYEYLLFIVIFIFILIFAIAFVHSHYEYIVQKSDIFPLILKFIGNFYRDTSKDTLETIEKEVKSIRCSDITYFNRFRSRYIIRGRYKFYNLIISELGLYYASPVPSTIRYVKIIFNGILIKVMLDKDAFMQAQPFLNDTREEQRQCHIQAAEFETLYKLFKKYLNPSFTRGKDCIYIPAKIPMENIPICGQFLPKMIRNKSWFTFSFNEQADNISTSRKIASRFVYLLYVIDQFPLDRIMR